MRRVVVIGAGAAGTMAAIFAAAAGAATLLVERTKDGGRKILISGGGRCNVLPARLDESRYVTDSSPNTLRKIVRAWPLAEQVAFFEREVGTPLAEEVESAKLFPVSQRARDVRDGLMALARRRGVRCLMEALVTGLAPRDGGGWTVTLDGAPPLDCDAVIVATGGLSVPATGSDGTGLRLLESLGHTLHPTYAALTPVTAPPSPYADLAGLSLRVTLTAHDATRTASASGGFLFTHRGYSGPSVLDVSHVLVRAGAGRDGGAGGAGGASGAGRAGGAGGARGAEAVTHLSDASGASGASRASDASGARDARIAAPARLRVQWAAHDERAWTSLLEPRGTRTVATVVRGELPDRLANALLDAADVDPSRRLAELTREERRRLVATLVSGELPWHGDEGYRKAEVTGGGVRLAEIDPRTMESRRHAGLYLCGEVLDAFGPIGGYNFLWAWVTGRAAGEGAARAGSA